MLQNPKQGFLGRLGLATVRMEGQTGEIIEQGLASVEQQLAAINRALEDRCGAINENVPAPFEGALAFGSPLEDRS